VNLCGDTRNHNNDYICLGKLIKMRALILALWGVSFSFLFDKNWKENFEKEEMKILNDENDDDIKKDNVSDLNEDKMLEKEYFNCLKSILKKIEHVETEFKDMRVILDDNKFKICEYARSLTTVLFLFYYSLLLLNLLLLLLLLLLLTSCSLIFLGFTLLHVFFKSV
jgi:hypothetical protein